MKRLILFLVVLFAPAVCFGQQTTIQATVIDPNGIPYAFGSGSASINCPGNQAPLYNGYSIPRTITITGMDGNGHFTQVLYDVNLITPLGCSYNFAITYKDGITSFTAPSIGASGSATPITGLGPVNLSVPISAYAVPIPNSGVAGVTSLNSLTGALTLAAGTNVTLSITGKTITISSIGGGTPGGVTGNAQFNASGVFYGAPGINTPDGKNLSIAGPDPFIDFTAITYGMPQGGCSDFTSDNWEVNEAAGVAGQITAGSHLLTNLAGFTSVLHVGCGIFVGGVGPLSSLGTPAIGELFIHGASGSTTRNYKVVNVDSKFGTSAASAVFTTTTSPATLTEHDYVDVVYTRDPDAVSTIIYTDFLTPGTYYPIGQSSMCGQNGFNFCGYMDDGIVRNEGWAGPGWGSWFLPQTPPTTQQPQALITTITNISGTTATLAAAATTGSSAQPNGIVFAQSDQSIFLDNAIATLSEGGPPATILIPYGFYNFSHFPSTARYNNATILDQGQIQMFAGPMDLPQAATWQGMGPSATTTGVPISCVNFLTAPWVPALITMRNGNTGMQFSGICARDLSQDGIVFADADSVKFHDILLGQTSGAYGSNILINGNIIFVQGDNISLTANGNGSENIQFRYQVPGGGAQVVFNNVALVGRMIGFDCANNANPGLCYSLDTIVGGNSTMESNLSQGMVNMDGIGSDFQGANIELPISDSINQPSVCAFYTLTVCTVNGTFVPSGYAFSYPGGGTPSFPVNGLGTVANGGSPTGSISGGELFAGIDYNGGGLANGYIVNGTIPGSDTVAYGINFWRPFTTLTTSGGGSLAAGTYYVTVEFTDVAGRTSAGSQEVPISVGASGQIFVTASSEWPAVSSCRVYVGTSPLGETGYFSQAMTTNFCNYTITTLSGLTTGVPTYSNNAMREWISAGSGLPDCLGACGPSGASVKQVGVDLNASQFASMAAPYGLWTSGFYNFGPTGMAEVTPQAGISGTTVSWANSANHWPEFNPNNTVALRYAGISGSIVAGDCAEFSDTVGTVVDAGGACGSGGSGSVTNFSVAADPVPLFTTSVANSGTTPALTFTKSNFAAHTFYGTNSGSTAAPVASLLGASDTTPPSYAVDTGAADAAVVTLTPAATALVAGLEVKFLPVANNATTTPTLNLNSLTAKTITKLGTAALVAGDLTTTAVAKVIYDGTRWQLQNPQTTAASGANITLSNLGTTSMNADLLPGSASARSLGSNTLPMLNVFVGSAGASKTASFSTSTLSTNRTITVPNLASIIPEPLTGTDLTWLTGLSGTTGIWTTASLASSSGATGITVTDTAGTVTLNLASSAGGGNAALLGTLTSPAAGQAICENTSIVLVNCAPTITANEQTGTTYAVVSTDALKLITLSNTSAIAVSVPTTFGTGFGFAAVNTNTGAATFTPGSGTICGNATLVLRQGMQANFVFDGTNYVCTVSGTPITIMDCGTTTTCAKTILLTPLIVKGTVPLSSGAPSTATLTALPFTSSTSYVCTATEGSSATGNLLKVVNSSGSSTVITGPATVTDTVNYVCAGS